ncbi:hypothetical protein OIU76_022277 [Salix suchowensis]|nr:hypothetical protein OIU76_022277 [Salix suchowensis]
MAFLQWLKESSKPTLLFVTIFLLVALKFLMEGKLKNRKLNLPPSPAKLPFIGNLHQLGSMPHISLRGLAKKYGPIIFLQLGEIPTVVISSVRLAKEVLKTHDPVLSSRPQLFSAKHLFYGCTDVAFAPYGAYWRNIRKICTLELLSSKRVQRYSFVREEEVARLIHRIAESYPGTANLSKMIGLYANDVLCRVALGRDFSGGGGEYDRHGFQKMLDDFQALLGGFSLGDYFPSMEFVHSLTGMKSKLQRTFRQFDQFFDEVITEHQNSKGGKEEKKDLVDVLLDIQRAGSSEMPLTMDNIKAVILVSEHFIGLAVTFNFNAPNIKLLVD